MKQQSELSKLLQAESNRLDTVAELNKGVSFPNGFPLFARTVSKVPQKQRKAISNKVG